MSRLANAPTGRTRLHPLLAALTAGTLLMTQGAKPAHAQTPERTALLGLDAADAHTGREVSDALARALDSRNILFRAPLTFAEFRLMMSCAPQNNRCLGKAGESFDAKRLMLGTIELTGNKTTVDLRLLKNQSGLVLSTGTFSFSDEQLVGNKLQASADYMVASMLAKAAGNAPPDFPFGAKKAAPKPTQKSDPLDPAILDKEPLPALERPEPREIDPAPRLPKARKDRKLVQANADRNWTKIGLGTSLALAAGAWGTALWTHVSLSPDGRIRKEILELAAFSVSKEDNDPGNDIRPDRPDSLCVPARNLRQDGSGRLYNPDIAAVCDRGDRLTKINTASLVTGTLFTVSAAVFLGLMIRDNKLKERKLSWSGGFMPGSGWSVSTGWRF